MWKKEVSAENEPDNNTPRLNRKMWSLCSYCKSCYTCQNEYSFPCVDCKDFSNWAPVNNFCEYCGRPFTNEAWASLEEQLRKCLE